VNSYRDHVSLQPSPRKHGSHGYASRTVRPTCRLGRR